MNRQAKQVLGFIIVVGGFIVLLAMFMLWDRYGAWVWLIPLALVLVVVVLSIRYEPMRRLVFGGLDSLGEWSKPSRANQWKERRNIPADVQRQVKERAGGVCEHPDCDRQIRNHFHHIDENPSHNVPENIFYICPNHHDEAHRGIITRAEQQHWASKTISTATRPRSRRSRTYTRRRR